MVKGKDKTIPDSRYSRGHYFLNLFFSYSWHTTLYYFHVCNIVIRHSYTLGSDQPVKSSTHLTPSIVITTSLTVFPMLNFMSLRLFILLAVNWKDYWHLFHLSPQPLLPFGDHWFVFYNYGFGKFISWWEELQSHTENGRKWCHFFFFWSTLL